MTPSPASPPPPPRRPASRRTGVDDCPHGLGDAAPQSGVEQLDNEDEAGAEHEQGGGQQDEAHGQVRERCARKQVAAWGRAGAGEPRAARGGGGARGWQGRAGRG